MLLSTYLPTYLPTLLHFPSVWAETISCINTTTTNVYDMPINQPWGKIIGIHNDMWTKSLSMWESEFSLSTPDQPEIATIHWYGSSNSRYVNSLHSDGCLNWYFIFYRIICQFWCSLILHRFGPSVINIRPLSCTVSNLWGNYVG